MEPNPEYHAIKVDTDKCFGCTHCLRICPTEAIRIRDGVAVINDERCVDCGNCLRACPATAFYVEQFDINFIFDYKYRVLLFPSVLVGQFPSKYSEEQIYQALLKLGFTHVYEVEQPIQWLIELLKDEVQNNQNRPVISSFCPAVVRLIQNKYPSLAENIAPVKAPHDMAAHFVIQQLLQQGIQEEEIGVFYVSPCSAKMAAVFQSMEEKSVIDGIINMNDLYNRMMQVMQNEILQDTSHFRRHISRDGILWSLPRGEARQFKSRAMGIDGIHNVINFLERLENDDTPDLDFLDLKSCNQGCAGGILMTGNRYLTVERLQKRVVSYPKASEIKVSKVEKETVTENLKTKKVESQFVFALDKDRVKAIEKLKTVDKILCQLPGIDCGACGAPNCHALAEDIVQGKGRMTDCIFIQDRLKKESKISTEKTWNNLEKIWGKKRFEADCNKKGGRNEGF